MTDISKQRSRPSKQHREGTPRDTSGTHSVLAGLGFAHVLVDGQRLLDVSWGSLKGRCKTADVLEPPDGGGSSALKQSKGRKRSLGNWEVLLSWHLAGAGEGCSSSEYPLDPMGRGLQVWTPMPGLLRCFIYLINLDHPASAGMGEDRDVALCSTWQGVDSARWLIPHQPQEEGEPQEQHGER